LSPRDRAGRFYPALRRYSDRFRQNTLDSCFLRKQASGETRGFHLMHGFAGATELGADHFYQTKDTLPP